MSRRLSTGLGVLLTAGLLMVVATAVPASAAEGSAEAWQQAIKESADSEHRLLHGQLSRGPMAERVVQL